MRPNRGATDDCADEEVLIKGGKDEKITGVGRGANFDQL